MTYDGPDPPMAYRYGDELQPGPGEEVTPTEYEVAVAHEEDDDHGHGTTWRVVHGPEV